MSTSVCTGQCTAGYYCLAGSTSPTTTVSDPAAGGPGALTDCAGVPIGRLLPQWKPGAHRVPRRQLRKRHWAYHTCLHRLVHWRLLLHSRFDFCDAVQVRDAVCACVIGTHCALRPAPFQLWCGYILSCGLLGNYAVPLSIFLPCVVRCTDGVHGCVRVALRAPGFGTSDDDARSQRATTAPRVQERRHSALLGHTALLHQLLRRRARR